MMARPRETLLVADALTGQDAVETARRFDERLKLTGLILTRMDGDSRGGAALSMRWVTGLPIKFLGTSEKVDGLDAFDAKRLAGRILGRGDIVSLVEKASAEVDEEKAERIAKKMAKGNFDLEDLSDQLRPASENGRSWRHDGHPARGQSKPSSKWPRPAWTTQVLKRQEAIISSMTREERAKPDILNASRKRRIAKGAGVERAGCEQAFEDAPQMADMMKKMGKKGGKGGFPGMPGMPGAGMPGGGRTPPGLDQAAGDLLKGNAPKGGSLPGLPGSNGSSSGGGLPGLPGGKKK